MKITQSLGWITLGLALLYLGFRLSSGEGSQSAAGVIAAGALIAIAWSWGLSWVLRLAILQKLVALVADSVLWLIIGVSAVAVALVLLHPRAGSAAVLVAVGTAGGVLITFGVRALRS